MNPAAKAKRFHGSAYLELAPATYRVVETKELRYVIVQERDVSYRFYLHQHPYVQQLMERLLSRGSSGLQAADTEYVPNAASLPGSAEVALGPNAGVTVPRDVGISLLSDLHVVSGGVPVDLAANMMCKLAAASQATLPDGARVTLVAGMDGTPPPGTPFTLPANSEAVLIGDTKIALTAATPIVLQDGTRATAPAGAQMLLEDASPVTVAAALQATLLTNKPLPVLYSDIFSGTTYNPSALVRRPYPVNDLDFTSGGAYSIYNWELFFHVPLTIAMHLSKNQRFAEAQHWFHYLFDPTDDSDGPTPERFWKVRPFQYTDVKKIEEILVNLATGADEALREETIRSIEAWENAPFRPHVIARYRQQAYMYKTVMAYLDNLIAWGDSLFRQDTGEAIDEATMLYILAANILGPPPLAVPKKGDVRPQTYANLRHDLAQFGIVLRDMEPDLPYDLMPLPAGDTANADSLAALTSMGKALYFSVPRNDVLLSYWDTVADRLVKIRNSLDIQGRFRQLPLFEPPIDPALLARATAAGLDVGAIVAGLNQPLPLVRFQFLVQKAAEIAQEVKSLGNSLLSAMEKEDGEALAVLRAKHERVILEMVEHVKYAQLQESIKSKEGLLKTLASAVGRYAYYELQLGRKPEEISSAANDAIQALGELDTDSLDKMKFSMKEPELPQRKIEVDIEEELGGAGGSPISSHESTELTLLEIAQGFQDAAAVSDTIASGLSAIPSVGVHATPMGVGTKMEFGGMHLHDIFSAISSASRGVAGRLTFEASKAAKMGSYERRQQEWAFQSNLAAGEINQIFKQVRAAEVRQAIAEMELKNHRQQIKHAVQIEQLLNEEGTEKKGKKTNRSLYAWMKREVKGLYAQCFQFAFDAAKKAERALQHELGDPRLSYLQSGYLAGKEGLLAGEKLYLDIRQMEMAYHELNQREYELTKHVSLFQLDPLALIELRTTGRCTVRLPEILFDMDGPGHYFRRIKTVAVSIPCVTGPYASVNCTLTLLKSSIRTSPVLRDGAYARETGDDDRFSDYFGALQSIVTSSAQNDAGLFETNLRDERYLPFENSGVISEWELRLPANPAKDDPSQFDYGTISDVILHVRYTAREGGDLLGKSAIEEVKELISNGEAVGSTRLFSARHEFPSEWEKFQSQIPGPNQRFELVLSLRPEHYPFWSQGRLNGVSRIGLLAQTTVVPVPGTMNVFEAADKGDGTTIGVLTKDASLGNLLRGPLTAGLPPTPVGVLDLFFDSKAMDDLWIAVTWKD